MGNDLWDVDHPYYCNEENYFARGDEQPGQHFNSWEDFMAEYEDVDPDLNLLFRWDWVEGEDYDLPEFDGDDNCRNGILKLFWMRQRKGIYAWCTIEVCRADEPNVKKYLSGAWDKIMILWDPISTGGKHA